MTAGLLPVTLTLGDRPVLLWGEGEGYDAKRRLLERAGVAVTDDPAAAQVAIVAFDDTGRRDDAVARLRAAGLLVNVVDTPDLCDFTIPAIVDRAPLSIAIATGGASAGLAAAIRQRIEAMLPPGLGRIATGLAEAKAELRRLLPDGGDRRRAIGQALAPGGALDPLVPQDDDAVARWVADGLAPPRDRMVTIRIDSPDPDRLRLGDARALGLADRIYHRGDIPAAILDRARADAERIPCTVAPAEAGPGLSVDLAFAA